MTFSDTTFLFYRPRFSCRVAAARKSWLVAIPKATVFVPHSRGTKIVPIKSPTGHGGTSRARNASPGAGGPAAQELEVFFLNWIIGSLDQRIRSLDHWITGSLAHRITRSLVHLIARLPYQPITGSLDHPTVRSPEHRDHGDHKINGSPDHRIT